MRVVSANAAEQSSSELSQSAVATALQAATHRLIGVLNSLFQSLRRNGLESQLLRLPSVPADADGEGKHQNSNLKEFQFPERAVHQSLGHVSIGLVLSLHDTILGCQRFAFRTFWAEHVPSRLPESRLRVLESELSSHHLLYSLLLLLFLVLLSHHQPSTSFLPLPNDL